MNQRKLLGTFSSLLLCILIIINVQVANATYADKALSQQATFSVMTRIVDKIEKYVEFLNQNEDFITKYYDIGDGLSVSFRRANVK